MIKKSFVCPYCFEKDDLYKIKFRCISKDSKCAPEHDDVYSKFTGTSKVKSKAFEIPMPTGKWDTVKGYANFKLPKKLDCPSCNEVSHLRICPNCHSELPYTIGDHKDLIFAVIGAKEAGKSHYIAVLIDQIQQRFGSVFKAHLEPTSDETIERYRQAFHGPIFRKREIIQATRSGRTDAETKTPLVYTLRFSKMNWFRQDIITNVSTLTFFDTAGEDLNAEELMRTENKYIYNSQGIILLIDPLQIPEVRHHLESNGVSLPTQNAESVDIITRTAKLIRNAKNLSQKQLIDIPIAVAFSKIDALSQLIDPVSPLKYEADHQGTFNLSDFENVNTEIEALLREWAGAYLIEQLKFSFKEYAFFGLTALGSNPHGGTKITKVQPLRVQDPFLWLLYKHNILKGKK